MNRSVKMFSCIMLGVACLVGVAWAGGAWQFHSSTRYSQSEARREFVYDSIFSNATAGVFSSGFKKPFRVISLTANHLAGATGVFSVGVSTADGDVVFRSAAITNPVADSIAFDVNDLSGLWVETTDAFYTTNSLGVAVTNITVRFGIDR